MPSHQDRVREAYSDQWWEPWYKRDFTYRMITFVVFVVCFALAYIFR